MKEIQKVAVLGAGVMGATIAAHLVNAGCDVVLLDLQIDKDGKQVNLADLAVNTMKKAKPSPIFFRPWLSRIQTGNFQNDLALLSDADWVIEVVKEDIKIKHKLFESILPHLDKSALLTSNTSGIPINELSEVLPEDIQPRFFGTHFFNPPRYMKLLEVIPGPKTDPELLKSFHEFGETTLGKGVVFAKDCPNFIANRIGVMAMMAVIHTMIEDEYGIEEVDKIMGPLTGRPKSAVFRTADLVGLDTFVHVSENLYEAAPEDEKRDLFKIPPFVKQMVEKGLLGNKSGSGFYKKSKGPGGKREIQTLDLETLEYRPKAKVKLPSIEMFKNIEDVVERIAKVSFSEDRVGKFVWKTLSEVLVYSVNRLGEVADDIVNVDRAMRWGFNWELGPFETWDALGVAKVAEKLEAEGREVPKLVRDMLDQGVTSFYDLATPQAKYFDGKEMAAVPERPNVLILADHKKDKTKIVKTSAGASLVDLGDGVLCLEFHSKMNAIGGDTIGMTAQAVKIAEEQGWEGLVVANQGGNFSAGANLMLLLMEAQEGNFEDIDLMVRGFQRATTSLRYCKRPVVVAPYGLTLGGGCEFSLHGDAIQASAETYMGLVEVGVGLIPAGGGTKEMFLRHVYQAHKRGEKNLLPALQKVFEAIGMAKVSTSGEEARDLGFLKDTDGITLNGDALVTAAKKQVLGLAAAGYTPPPVPNDIPILGEPGFAALKMALYMMEEGGYITPHDKTIATHLGRILTGGNLTPGQTMTEQDMLDLEREAFLRLTGERKTLERIHHMLTTNKPLRN
ncbi:3-hydroxyacyl-CoA dehydrogenase [Sulfidibacter corallicola]|uniref:Enoyl-CoA hydratase/isomerase family protein n=1 Tax=Sulfidibacter corallicola TaxID=2818388 RepID=A0A8A4TQ70_SULCO|nr:3-hydroxyacyl-CoA dehydrogenase/enoyl-CoA hydratase family protein [Sulfidibacter corallicola]QTD51071.1 enoyl-CoA hydratase/isomerase family protein [Sulfidibacter corallicola]